MALRILLADDSMTAQNMGKKILTDAGYDVVTVSNGAAAVKKIAEVTPDLAILDVYMPGYNGLEVCERVKSSPATAGIPVLLSVGKMEPFRPEEGMKVKANGVIIKPFEATDLVTVVGKLASRVAAKPEAPATAVAAAAAASAVAATAATSMAAPAEDHSEPVASAPAHAEPAGSEAPTSAADPEETDSFGPAPALQTFEPADEPFDPLGEPHLESHAAAPLPAVETVTPPEFEATAIQQPEAQSARSVMTEAALMDGFSFSTSATHEEASGNDVLSDEDREFLSLTGRPDAVTADPEPEQVAPPLQVPAPEHTQPAQAVAAEPATWHAQEEELTDDDLALDLENVMRRAESNRNAESAEDAPVVAAGAAGSDSAPVHDEEITAASAERGDDSVFDPFVDLTAPANVAPARSTAAPIVAPIGKTSFDEFDAIMEQASAKFESSPTAAAAAPTRDEPALTAAEPEPEADILLSDDVNSRPEYSDVEPDLMVEEAPVASEFEAAPPSMHRSDALSGVFELDAPAQPDPAPAPAEQPETAPVILLEEEAAAEAEASTVVAATNSEEPIFEAAPAVATFEPLAEPEPMEITSPDTVAADSEPVHAVHAAPVEAAECAVADNAADLAVAAVNAEMQSVPEGASDRPVERVVERVVDRLRPMLTAMIEEIMKEFKKD